MHAACSMVYAVLPWCSALECNSPLRIYANIALNHFSTMSHERVTLFINFVSNRCRDSMMKCGVHVQSVEFRALEAFYSGHICIVYRVEKLLVERLHMHTALHPASICSVSLLLSLPMWNIIITIQQVMSLWL